MNTFTSSQTAEPERPTALIRATEAEKVSQLQRLRAFQHEHEADAQRALEQTAKRPPGRGATCSRR